MHARRFISLTIASLLICMTAQSASAQKSAGQRWERDIQAFEAADRASPPPEGAILFAGSSTIRMWNTLAADFPEHKVLNRGFGGCQIVDCTEYAQRIIIPCKPRLIVLRAGGNDIAAGKTPEQVAADFRAFVEKVRAQLPEVRIAYLTINATPARWAHAEREEQANRLIKDIIDKGQNLDYIDAFPATLDAGGKPREDLMLKDRLHFNAEGYKILAAIVRKHLPAAPPPADGRTEKQSALPKDSLTEADRKAIAWFDPEPGSEGKKARRQPGQ